MNLPNKLTITRLILLIPLLFFLLADFEGAQYFAALVYLAGVTTDILDGYIARKYHLETAFGKFIDPIADKMLVVTALIVLVEQGVVPAVPVIVIIAREFIISGFRLVAVADEGKIISANWLGKVKTSTQNAAIVMLLLGNWPFRMWGIPADMIMFYISVFFTLWSGIDYMVINREVLRHIVQQSRESKEQSK